MSSSKRSRIKYGMTKKQMDKWERQIRHNEYLRRTGFTMGDLKWFLTFNEPVHIWQYWLDGIRCRRHWEMMMDYADDQFWCM